MKYNIKLSLFRDCTARGEVRTTQGNLVMLAEFHEKSGESFMWVMYQIWRFLRRRHAKMTDLKVAEVHREGYLSGVWTAEAA